MKVKLIRMYGASFSYNYEDDHTNIPLSIGVTDWEEICDNDFYNLRNAVIQFNLKNRNEGYTLVMLTDHNIDVNSTIKNEIDRMEKVGLANKKLEADRWLKAEKIKRDKALKKALKSKQSKLELFNKLKEELEIK